MEISRDKYIEYRNSNSIPIEILFEYYKEKCKNCASFNEFENKLHIWMNHGGNLERFWSENDKEFHTLRLEHNGVFLGYR